MHTIEDMSMYTHEFLGGNGGPSGGGVAAVGGYGDGFIHDGKEGSLTLPPFSSESSFFFVEVFSLPSPPIFPFSKHLSFRSLTI